MEKVKVHQILIQHFSKSWRKEENILFNDALNTFIYGYMPSDIS